MGIIALAGAAQLFALHAAVHVRHGREYRRLAPGAPPEAEAKQRGEREEGGRQLPAPESAIVRGDLDYRRRGCRLQGRIFGHHQGLGGQGSAFQGIGFGIPPDHFHRW